jgi:hypothetical protein
MKAIVRETYGPPDVLHLEEVPRPTLRDGDVLVRVRAASANAGDWHLLRGTPFPFRLVAGLRIPKFKIIGTDALLLGPLLSIGRQRFGNVLVKPNQADLLVLKEGRRHALTARKRV